MIKFKEFSDQHGVDLPINLWLKKNQEIKILDVKYSANGFGSHVLIMYEEDSKDGKQDSGK